ncbi:hypothetical protein [Criblamydia sequanensis]|uniref:Membrane protein n=1 Tax=Candidatus Criblamydia sequanensis CRIB-18 TaxID=1437425 RepID=A0A090D2N8_9BACT|nr:hypothetical protein [Criblamydia sequanensis]CDR34780.1 Putative membrane protein [Criblamydia sequanensis CRIB-18]
MEKTASDEPIVVWSAYQVGFAAFISGPLGASFFIARNYKALQNIKAANKSLIIGLLGNFVLLTLAFLFFEKWDRSLVFGITVSYILFLSEFVKKFQGNELKELLANGAKKGSTLKLILISLGFFVLYNLIGISTLLLAEYWLETQLL